MECRSGVEGLAVVERQAPVSKSLSPGRAPPSSMRSRPSTSCSPQMSSVGAEMWLAPR